MKNIQTFEEFLNESKKGTIKAGGIEINWDSKSKAFAEEYAKGLEENPIKHDLRFDVQYNPLKGKYSKEDTGPFSAQFTNIKTGEKFNVRSGNFEVRVTKVTQKK